VGEVDVGEFDVLPLDVAPDVQFGPVGEREDADVLAGAVPAVVQVPQFRALAARLPLAETVAQAEDPLLGAGAFLVAPAAAEHRVVAVLVDRVQQRHGLQRVAGAVRPFDEAAVVDVVLHGRHFQPQAVAGHDPIAEVDDLGEVVAGVHVHDGKRDVRGPERLRGEREHDDRVLATGEQQRGTLELGRDLTHDVDRLGLEYVEL